VRSWILYSLLRVGLFAVALLVLWWLLGPSWDDWWWLAAIFAALIALCISYIFFGRLRERVVADLAERSSRKRPNVDELAEDGE
jgi:divalent metal cation (Fe/Co/Zn/Cd) transporter